MRVLVTGSRDWPEPLDVWRRLHALAIRAYGDYDGGHQLTVVHGDWPAGVDHFTHMWVKAQHKEIWKPVIITEDPHPAKWEKYGRAAGPLRDQEMVDAGAGLCLAWNLNNSRGTADCVRRARAAGIPVELVERERGSEDDWARSELS